MPELTEGSVFADHRIEGLAGRGGMGVVYRATQLTLDRLVALKLIAPALAEDPEFRERFVSESRAAASIEHPNVIPIYHAGERDGQLFIVMRHVEGQDLRALIRAAGPLAPARAAHVVAQVGAGLDAAHARGLVHRDVKPANVLLAQGDHAYLTDFGLTRHVGSQTASTGTGGWVGTLGYVAPEQIRGELVDARADVYALGCVLVHALTGRVPFVRDSDEATLWAHLNDEPPGEADGVPPDFLPVVRRALAKQPADRFPSAGDLGRAALAAAGVGSATEPERMVAVGDAAPSDETHAAPGRSAAGAMAATHAGDTAPAGGASRRRTALVALAAVLLVAGGAVAAVLAAGGPAQPAAGPATPPGATADGPTRPWVAVTREVGRRPNALTLGGGFAWAGSASDGSIARYRVRSGEYESRVAVGRGVSALAAGYGRLWVVKGLTRSLLRLDLDSARRTGPAIALPGEPFAVDTGADAVWVALREPDAVLRVDRRTGAQRLYPVADGVHTLTVGYGAVWVANRTTATVTRISPDSGDQQRIQVGRRPSGLEAGQGAVWVSNSGEESLARISTSTLRASFIDLPHRPTRVTTGAGAVWVTSRVPGELVQVDPEQGRVVGEPVDTGRGSFEVGAGDGYVWVTVLNEDALRQVRVPDR